MTSSADQKHAHTLEAQAQSLKGWRERLLRTVLVSSAVLHLVGGSLYALAWTSAPTTLTACLLGTGAAHLALRLVPGRVPLRSAIFMASALGEVVLLGAHVGWAPGVVLALLFGTVFGGLLLGRVGALMMPVGGLLAFIGGGLAVGAGWSIGVTPPPLGDAGEWLRIGALFTSMVAIMAITMHFALRVLHDARLNATAALREAVQLETRALTTRSSRRTAEVVVQDAQRLQTLAQLSGGVAHLLNNTLTVVRSAAEQLADPRTSPEEVCDVATTVVESVDQAGETMRALLSFGRRAPPQPRPVRLDARVRDLRGALEETLPENITLSYSLGATPPVLAEARRIEQLIVNLLLNARDAIVAGGSISISTGVVTLPDADAPTSYDDLPPGDYAALTVIDDGVGMSSRVMARACEPFFTTKDVADHEGLGLFVVFGLLSQWGGSLAIQSTEGEGSRVTAYLPLSDGDETTGEAAEPTSNEASAASLSQAEEDGRRPGARASEPSAATDDWREPSLRRALLVSTIVFGGACLASVFFGKRFDLFGTVGTAGGFLLCLLAWRSERLPRAWRVAALVASMVVVTGGLLLRNGYMAPGAVAGLATAVLVTAVYGNRIATFTVLLVTGLLFVVGSQGPVMGSWFDANSDPLVGANWARIAVLVPLVCLVTAYMVLDVLASSMRSVDELDSSIQSLLRARRRHTSEASSFARTQSVAARAARLEAAGQVAGSVAHDLNNALTGMLGWASLLCDEDCAASAEDVRASIQAFEESCELAEALVIQLEPHALREPDEAESTDLAVMVERSRGVVRRMLRQAIVFQTELRPGCYAPVADNELRRILLNLVANARDAMPHGGTLHIRCAHHARSGEVTLEVADTGIGMDEGAQRQAFDAFYTTKAEHRGTGLGLHTVAHIVRSSGGDITVSSAPGVGARFTMRWPEAEAPREKPVEVPTRPAESRGLLLFAEDDEWVRKAMARGLEHAGFTVVVAVDGTDARARLEERDDWDALCTDAVMPGLASADLIREFQARFPDRPVVLCSGYLPSDIDAIVSAGEVRFVPKPFPPATLVAALHEEIEARRRGGRPE